MKLLNLAVVAALVTGGAYGSCKQSISMTELKNIYQTGGIDVGNLRFEPTSLRHIRDVLPSDWSPTSLTGQANLREEISHDDGVIECRYGYKSAGGALLSKFSFWKKKEDLNEELDYTFILYHDPNPEPEPVIRDFRTNTNVENNQSDESTSDDEPSAEVIQEMLSILDLADNAKITWRIIQLQYGLMKDRPDVDINAVEGAFAELSRYFGR